MDGVVHDSIPNPNSVPPFLSKIYDMIDDSSTNSVVSWSSASNSFVVWSVPEFSRDILPNYFKHSNFSSFVRQLNSYGFRKVDPVRWEFANEGFLKGQKHLLKNISRRKPANNVQDQHQPRVQSSSVGPCIDVEKPVLVEEVERLEKDKNVLMQELVSLRQQQQTTDHQLQIVGDRVHVMEQRQKQVMSFLAKAVRSSGFLNQLVQQQQPESSNRHVTESNKKRRLSKQDEEKLDSLHGPNASDGKIARYRSSFNEAAKAMLHQMMKMNASRRLESLMNNPGTGTSRTGNVPPENSFGTERSSSQISEMPLSEVSPNLETSVPREPVSCPSTAFSENQSSSCSQIPLMNGQNLGNMPGSTVANPHLMSHEAGNVMDQLSPVLDRTIPIQSSIFPHVSDMDIALDSLWEQFLVGSSLNSDIGEMHSGFLESGVTKELKLLSEQNGLDNILQMNHLTEHMGLLVSDNKVV